MHRPPELFIRHVEVSLRRREVSMPKQKDEPTRERVFGTVHLLSSYQKVPLLFWRAATVSFRLGLCFDLHAETVKQRRAGRSAESVHDPS